MISKMNEHDARIANLLDNDKEFCSTFIDTYFGELDKYYADIEKVSLPDVKEIE